MGIDERWPEGIERHRERSRESGYKDLLSFTDQAAFLTSEAALLPSETVGAKSAFVAF